LSLAHGVQSIETSGINIYPNPVSSSFSVNGITGINRVLIYDMLGKCIMMVDALGETSVDINIESVPNGIYQLQIINQSGSVSTKRIVKQ